MAQSRSLRERWMHQLEHSHKCLNKHCVMYFIDVLTTNFGNYYEHTMFKCCQYVIS
jgi:hypothetical protein